MQEVGLTQPRSAVNKEWVIGTPWGFGNGLGGCEREAVGRSSDKRIERKPGVQADGASGPRCGGGRKRCNCGRGWERKFAVGERFFEINVIAKVNEDETHFEGSPSLLGYGVSN